MEAARAIKDTHPSTTAAAPCIAVPTMITALIGFIPKCITRITAQVGRTTMTELAQCGMKQPTGDRSPMGCAGSSIFQHALLMTATAAKVSMESRQADVSAATAAAAAGAMTAAITGAETAAMTRSRTAAMTDGAVAIDRMPVAVVARHRTFAVNRSAAGAAVVRVAATGGMTMAVEGLGCGWHEHREGGDSGQGGDELFHDGMCFSLSHRRQSAACHSDEVLMRLFS